MMNLPDELKRLLREVPALSRAYLVGGCVRDSMLGILDQAFEAQLEGKFADLDGALKWLDGHN